MFISIGQVERSLKSLEKVNPFFGIAFLACKTERIPTGSTKPVVFSQIADDILNRYYRPCSSYMGFYNPFKTSKISGRWVDARYGSTSLQRITTNTFGDVFLHPRNVSRWGWKADYVQRLSRHLDGKRIPAFDLAVWLFRLWKWPTSVSPDQVFDKLIKTFQITNQEKESLFDLHPPRVSADSFAGEPILEEDLLEMLGPPPGTRPSQGAALRSLQMRHIGPAAKLQYRPAERLNVILGDNTVGKSFLLETVWWALTGSWAGLHAFPRPNVAKISPRIEFTLGITAKNTKSFAATFDWNHQAWRTRPDRADVGPGLAIFARHDGSFVVWDPALKQLLDQEQPVSDAGQISFTPQTIWNGVPKDTSGSGEWLCNGLLRDWVSWQTDSRYRSNFEALSESLKGLSPSEDEPLEPGRPVQLGLNSVEIPTLRMPYGETPVTISSAGVQRTICLAYLMVWAWHKHLQYSSTVRQKPQRRLVLLIDEAEAHLHPKWQRVIVPSVLHVIQKLTSVISPQVHLATHSPMVMASIETGFNQEMDRLHHLKLGEDGDARLEELPFIKRGRIDLWLMSDIFGLKQARSLEAEKAISAAKDLQLKDNPSPDAVRQTNARLMSYLAQDDDFWPRWRFFAKTYGVK
ncbi:MAG: ATP-binding protein [Planctomycetaceae bacterium]|nr:ATP-binding protein [Planctomycetaceae bacterium]